MSNAGWWVLIMVASVLCAGIVILLARAGAWAFEGERKLAVELAQTGHSASAEVLSLERRPGGEPFAAPMKLGVRYLDEAGHERRADLSVYIDNELLVNFMPGRTVHLRYDPADPSRIAVDRQQTPTEIPAAWRDKP